MSLLKGGAPTVLGHAVGCIPSLPGVTCVDWDVMGAAGGALQALLLSPGSLLQSLLLGICGAGNGTTSGAGLAVAARCGKGLVLTGETPKQNLPAGNSWLPLRFCDSVRLVAGFLLCLGDVDLTWSNGAGSK